MKLLFLLILLSAFSQVELVAQPVLNNVKLDKMLGTTVERKSQKLNTDGFSFKDTLGANVKWDFSKLAKVGSIGTSSYKYVKPSETPYGSKFPTANMAIVSLPSQNSYAFMNVTDEKMELHGSVGIASGTAYATIFDNIRIDGQYPFKYQDSYSDDFSYYPETTPDFKITGSVTQNYAGYGTFITPDYTATDVIMVKRVDVTVQGPSVTTSVMYSWNDPASMKLLGILQLTQAGVSFSYTIGGPNNVEDKQITKSLVISPNPSDGHSLFQIESSAQENATLEVTNMLGQVVEIQNVELNNGLNSLEISVPTTGIYSVNIRTTNHTWTTKWVVN